MPFFSVPRANLCSDICTFMQGHNLTFDPIFWILLSIRMKFGTGNAHKPLLRGCEFRENCLSEIHTVLTGVSEFLPIVFT